MALRVLVVDDDPAIHSFLQNFLTSKGADVVLSDFASDIPDLVERLHPDVVLLALMGRDNSMVGLGVLGLLRFFPETDTQPVLLMSVNHSWLSVLAPRLRDLRVDVVPKPFEPEQLWQAIEQAAGRA